ncbi:MAG: hypothetical protein U0P30_09040 [Vicinamibacterales bacterium]
MSTVAHAVGLLITLGAGVELTARVHDLVRDDVPLLSSPDKDADLVVQDDLGLRGRPHGRHKVWRLNAFGFRSPDMTEAPAPGCTRVMTLGASETFGLYETPGHEYPTQLASALRATGCHEVVNAAIYGMTVPDIDRTWTNWDARFRPAIVTIYPTPAFYLSPNAPHTARPRPAGFARPAWWMPRALDRARDVIEYPAFVQQRRVEREIARIDGAHEASWFYREVPADRLAQFEADMSQLVAHVAATGARVIVVTHAHGFRTPPDAGDAQALLAWRTLVQRATPDVLLAFESAARTATLRVAAGHGVEVVDLAAEMNGRREWFAGDLLHFNDTGAGVVAARLASAITGVAAAAR